MRIGSFFIVLLIALISLGFFIADAMHLREAMASQQNEIEKLTTAVQQTQQEKQNVLTALQNSEQERQIALADLQTINQHLQSCRQEVNQTQQLVNQLTDENMILKEQSKLFKNLSLPETVSASVQPPIQPVSAIAFRLFTLFAVGFGSVIMLRRPNGVLKKLFFNGDADKKGSYVYLTHAEIQDLAQRRRRSNEHNS